MTDPKTVLGEGFQATHNFYIGQQVYAKVRLAPGSIFAPRSEDDLVSVWGEFWPINSYQARIGSTLINVGSIKLICLKEDWKGTE